MKIVPIGWRTQFTVENMAYPRAGETMTHSRPLGIYTGLRALGMRILFP